MRIWIERLLLNMARITNCFLTLCRDKFGWCKLHWPRSAHNVEVQQPIVSHAQPDGSALQEIFHTVTLRFQIIKLLCFARILPCILSSRICSVPRIERQNMHCRGGEHRQVEIVRVHPLIIIWQSTLSGNPFCILVVLLLRLMWPREKKSTIAGDRFV